MAKAISAELFDNAVVAARLREYGDLLTQQGVDGFRVHAYERAADVVTALDTPIREIFAQRGRLGLTDLPGVGRSIAAAIVEILVTGRWSQLERLRGALDPEGLFRTVPGIGPSLARRLSEGLRIETLEALEAAAHDGRLDSVAGFGQRRVEMVRTALASRLGRARMRHLSPAREEPPVELLLDVDSEYRDGAVAGRLRRIAPKRFNPSGEAWLPILHTQRGKWELTALFSNTQRAHELGRTRDWVVIYYHADADDVAEAQCTVVTQSGGPLTGRRVIRGREQQCEAWYAHRSPGTAVGDPQGTARADKASRVGPLVLPSGQGSRAARR